MPAPAQAPLETRDSPFQTSPLNQALPADQAFALSALVELRGGYGLARTSQLNAQLGGVSAALGMRYTP